MHPNYINNPHNGESSGSYNKPASVMHWVREAQINETFVLFIDADMLLRAPIDPVALGVRKGLRSSPSTFDTSTMASRGICPRISCSSSAATRRRRALQRRPDGITSSISTT